MLFRSDIDIFDDINNLSDLRIRVYINGNRTSDKNWVVVNSQVYKKLILLNTDLTHTIESTDSTTNLVYIKDTSSLKIGQQVLISTSIGNLQPGVPYYVTSIPTIHSFSVSTSIDGTDVILSLDFGNVTLYTLKDISLTDVITIRAFSKQPVNQNGYYEIPVNLQNNPSNDEVSLFTLGEVLDHVNSIVDNNWDFAGEYPGISNLRDLGNVSKFGTKFIKHSSPYSLSMYHITDDNVNVIDAIEKSKNDYNKFKHNFITVAETLGVDTDTKQHVDLILKEMTKNIPSTSAYYFSDMVPFEIGRAHV